MRTLVPAMSILVFAAGCGLRSPVDVDDGGTEDGGGTGSGTSGSGTGGGSSGEATGGATQTGGTGETGDDSDSAESGDPTGEGEETGMGGECPEPGDPGIAWVTELGDGAVADAVAIDAQGWVAVAGTDADSPTLWRLDASGVGMWAYSPPVEGVGVGVSVNDAGDAFMAWNEGGSTFAFARVSAEGEEIGHHSPQQMGSTVQDIAMDPEGGVVMAGWAGSADNADIEFWRFDEDGMIVWVVHGNTNWSQLGHGIAARGNLVYIVGEAGGDILVESYDLVEPPIDGYSRIIEGGPTEWATAVAVDEAGNAVVSGICLDNDQQPVYGWLGRFDLAGEDLWKNDHTCFDWPFGPVHDVAISPQDGTFVLATSLDGDGALVGVDDDGELAWTQQIVGPNDAPVRVTTVSASCDGIAFAGQSDGKAIAGLYTR